METHPPSPKERREHSFSPHSLGTLIEWKRKTLKPLQRAALALGGPHSLGTLIEWKRAALALGTLVSLSPLAGDIN